MCQKQCQALRLQRQLDMVLALKEVQPFGRTCMEADYSERPLICIAKHHNCSELLKRILKVITLLKADIQTNGIKSLERNPHIYGQMIYCQRIFDS